jgi:LysR family transcriptional regulator, low CO2-responsive transcriptional regulator
MKTITFRQLRVFIEVGRQLSFARAAENLHLSAPAVTMQVKELEASVGMPLFDRRGKKVSLTVVGEYFLLYAKRLQATMKDAENAMNRFQRLESGMLILGILGTTQYFIPHLIAKFKREHVGIDVKLQVAPNREKLVELLKFGEIDLGIMGRPPKELDTREDTFAANPLVFVSAPEHRLCSQSRVSLEALEAFPIIAREQGSGTRSVLDRLFSDKQVELRIAMEVNSNEAIKQSVMAGLGIGLLPLHTIGLEVGCGLLKVLEVEDTPVMRSWNVVRIQSKSLSPAAEAFRNFLIAHAESFLLEKQRTLQEMLRS